VKKRLRLRLGLRLEAQDGAQGSEMNPPRFFQIFSVTLAWRRGKSIAYEKYEMLF
jgi:hypothetical protein